MTNDATPGNVPLSDLLGPSAWAVTAHGRVQKLVMRADVADEAACKWRESDPEATAVPLYSWPAIEGYVAAERERLRGLLMSACSLLRSAGMSAEADDLASRA